MTRPAIRPFIRADLDWLVATHDRLYAQEAGFDATFGAVVRDAAQQLLDRADPRERGFVAEVAKARVGSIFSTRLDDDTGQVRLFLILPDWRGRECWPRLKASRGRRAAPGCGSGPTKATRPPAPFMRARAGGGVRAVRCTITGRIWWR